MRKTTLAWALVVGLAGASTGLAVGCGGDDSGTNNDTPDSSTSGDAAHDSSIGHTDSSSDTSTPQPDTGVDGNTPQPDGGQDGSSPDGGTDASDGGAHDASDGATADASDGSAHDASDGATADASDGAAADASDGAASDASDGAAADAGSDGSSAADASDGSTSGFDNPVQIDVSAVLDANTVSTTTLADAGALTSMDKSNYDVMTHSRATQLNAGGVGLPDDAFFAANGVVHPKVQLHWSNATNGPNSHVATDSTPFTFAVPQANYTQLQIYGVSTEGSSTVNVLVTYADNSTNGGVSITVADWFNATNAGQFTLISGLDRIQNGTTFESDKKPGITGVNVNPDSSKAVKQITITNHGSGYFVFYGATAW